MEIKYNLNGKTLCAELKGELDEYTAEYVRLTLDSFLKEKETKDAEELILDFSSVSFMDSTGIGVLLGRYNKFSKKIPYPELKIRKMTSRWGVCNTRLKTITLNLELIKRDIKYLDYVIVHELSHLVHGDHSSRFWDLVGINYEGYKEIRKEMRDF